MMRLKGILKNNNIAAMARMSWQVSWPMTVIMFLVFVIGFSDVYVAGRFGKELQAAYGLAFQVFFILTIIAGALSVGTVSVVSRLFTSANKESFIEAVDSSLITACIAGGLLGIVGALVSKHIIASLSVPAELKAFAAPLLRVYSVGLVFHYLVMTSNGILRASAMIRKSMVTMAFVCAVNIALNFYLPFKTKLGFQGIAWATVISMFLGCALNIVFVRTFISSTLRFSFSVMRSIVGISLPAGILQLLWQVGAMVLFVIIGKLPAHAIETMAAFTNGLKIESAIFLPAFAFNMASAVIVGNLLGKREKETAFKAGVITAALGVLIIASMSAVAVFNAEAIARFLSNNPIVVQECTRYIYISLIAEPIMAWGVILGGSLNGAGDTVSVMKIVSLSIWLVRIPCSYLFGVYLGYGAAVIWWSMNLSIVIQSFFISKHYFSRKWLHNSEKNLPATEVK